MHKEYNLLPIISGKADRSDDFICWLLWGFKPEEVALIEGVSRATCYRRIKEGIHYFGKFYTFWSKLQKLKNKGLLNDIEICFITFTNDKETLYYYLDMDLTRLEEVINIH